jgi:cyanophycin synthetase
MQQRRHAKSMLTLTGLRVYTGANLHCGFAAAAAEFEFFAPPPVAIGAWLSALGPALEKLLPALATADTLPAFAQLHLPADPPEAAGMALGWLCVRLQNLAGAAITETQIACARGTNNRWIALCGYEVAEVAVDAVQLACTLLQATSQTESALRGDWRAALQAQLGAFEQSAGLWHLDLSTRALVNAARKRNIPAYRISPPARFVQLGQGVRQHHIFETESERTAVTGSKLSHNKIATSHLLRQLGIPTPLQGVANTLEQAQAVATRIGFPLVVKPSHGMKGIGVSVDVRDPQELAAAVNAVVAARCGDIVIEKFVPGDDYRLLVVSGRLVAAARLIPACVTGDGVFTIEQLLMAVNRDPRRGTGFLKLLNRIVWSEETARVVAGQGFAAADIPARGRVVYLRKTGNIATGGTAVDVTDEVHPEVRAMAELIARAFKLDVTGIDYLTHDIARSYRDGGGAVCEVNACPGLRPHWCASDGRDEVSDTILDQHFPGAANGRIPTVAITGSWGKTTTARMVARILESAGLTTALACSDGVKVGERIVREGDSAGGTPARAVLLDPDAEAAVLEIARGGLIRAGMPVDQCDVSTVLNVGFNHIGQNGIESIAALAAVKALVARAATRYVVLNADDPHCVSMAVQTGNVPVCWVSAAPDNPRVRAHVDAGGMAAVLSGIDNDARICIWRDTHEQPVIGLAELPSTMQGLLRINAINALFATATASALGIAADAIRTGLASFRADFAQNPGHLNLYNGARCRVLLDRADSPHDMQALCEVVRQLPTQGRRILVFTAPGNRLDAHISDTAIAAAGLFDQYICYGWGELRGRQPDEVPNMLARALTTKNTAAEAIDIIPAQERAIDLALQQVTQNDLLVVVCFDWGPRLRAVWQKITTG